MTPEAVIVSAVRSAVGKAPRGALRNTRPEVMGATVVAEAVRRAEGLDPALIEDVILGCAFPEGKQGMQVARIIALAAGLPQSVPGQTVNRFCSSGLQSIALAAERIIAGFGDVIVAGGVESMSSVPQGGLNFTAEPGLAIEYPAIYTGMGLTAENVAQQYQVNRADQDAFSLQSHQRAAAAIQSGRFAAEIVGLPTAGVWLDEDGRSQSRTAVFDTDEGVRYDTSLAGLTKLKPVFKAGGTVTAGNSSQTSDGAAAVVVMSRRAAETAGLKPLARFVAFAAAGVPPEIMGIGPVAAIPKALKLAGLSLNDIDLIELNEAFAAQSLAVIRQMEIDPAITNVNGGAIALGHPLGATGAKLTTQLIHEMARRGSRYGMVTMCIGGGMGAAGIFENLQ
ncbi:MAG: acetyl-CoA C-acyltransferase [Caldilineales bacterium]|nr:acetyl-CoA C-acyltransferase [Caldilineales bacterium]MCW5857323.1 acetyl-CoA C-acyltransferase [Caldilineales bacterium]